MLGDDVRQTSVCRVFAANDKLKFVGHSGEWIDPATELALWVGWM